MCPFCLLMLIWPHADFLKICAVIQAGLFFFFFLRSSMVEIRMKCCIQLQFDLYQNNIVCPKKETLSNKKK